MKNDEHFGKRGLAPNALANIRMANEQTIFRTEKTISKQNSRIELWRERNLAKAPPGYSVNLEGPRGHPPEEVTTPERVQNPVGDKFQLFTILYNEINMVIDKKITIQIFTNVSKFYKMKKQILLFVLFVVATFASISKSYGQTCTPGPESPAAGITYDYGVSVTAAGTGGTYLWYVTTGTNILNPSTILADGSDFTVETGGSTYSSTTGGTNNIKLKWKSSAIIAGTPYYLVVKYSETAPQGSCNLENMKVFRIQPVNSFLLAVTGSDLTGATATYTCAAPISSATVTPVGTNSATVTYTYGKNTLYYKVTASGIVGAWKPVVSLPALAGNSQKYESVKWTADGGTTYTTMTGAAGSDLTGGTFTTTADATVSDAVNGSSIIVQVVIDNQNYETLSDQTIKLKVDGFLDAAFSISDIVSAGTCTTEAPFGKDDDMIIQKRATVVATTPGTTPLISQVP